MRFVSWLAGFTSRWMKPRSWAYAQASNTCNAHSTARSTSIGGPIRHPGGIQPGDVLHDEPDLYAPNQVGVSDRLELLHIRSL